jgi:hypothetical protein
MTPGTRTLRLRARFMPNLRMSAQRGADCLRLAISFTFSPAFFREPITDPFSLEKKKARCHPKRNCSCFTLHYFVQTLDLSFQSNLSKSL